MGGLSHRDVDRWCRTSLAGDRGTNPDTLVEGREVLGPSVGLKACGRPQGPASVQSAPGSEAGGRHGQCRRGGRREVQQLEHRHSHAAAPCEHAGCSHPLVGPWVVLFDGIEAGAAVVAPHSIQPAVHSHQVMGAPGGGAGGHKPVGWSPGGGAAGAIGGAPGVGSQGHGRSPGVGAAWNL